MNNIKYAYGLDNEYTLTLIITNQCNLHCDYCLYYGRVNDVNKHYLSPIVVNNFMDVYFNDINNTHPINMVISGGEPTLSPYFLDIVELCANNSSVNNIFILTNGLCDPNIFIKANSITKQYNKLLFVCISIHMSQINLIDKYIEKINYLTSNNIYVRIKAIVDPSKINKETLLYLQSNNIEISPLFGSNITRFKHIQELNLYNSVKNKLLIHYDNNSEEICSLFDIRIQKHNPFKGYYCTSSFQNITVNEDGYVFSSCFATNGCSCWSKSKLQHFNIIIKQHRKCLLDVCNCYHQPIRYKDISMLPYLIDKQKENIAEYKTIKIYDNSDIISR
jgi:organic radical activating enzyme